MCWSKHLNMCGSKHVLDFYVIWCLVLVRIHAQAHRKRLTIGHLSKYDGIAFHNHDGYRISRLNSYSLRHVAVIFQTMRQFWPWLNMRGYGNVRLLSGARMISLAIHCLHRFCCSVPACFLAREVGIFRGVSSSLFTLRFQCFVSPHFTDRWPSIRNIEHRRAGRNEKTSADYESAHMMCPRTSKLKCGVQTEHNAGWQMNTISSHSVLISFFHIPSNGGSRKERPGIIWIILISQATNDQQSK